MTTTETRLSQVEDELAEVTARLYRLEAGEATEAPAPGPVSAPAPVPVGVERPGEPFAWMTPAPRDRTAAPARSPQRSAIDLEAVFGGRVLAWIGGVAILFGAVLFLGMAISRGWLDEETRTIIAAALSLLGLAGGVWLHERRGRTEAARALVGAAISGLYGTIVVAAQAYSLISPGFGLACAAAVAAVGFLIAVRWQAPIVAAIGSLGALAMPTVIGAANGVPIAFVATALVPTVAILVWQRWDWLALGAFLVSAPQLLTWAAFENEQRGHVVLILAVLFGFWLLYAVAALGYELRKRAEALPVASWLLLFGAATTFVGPAYFFLDRAGHHTGAVVLLFAFAALQAALGIAAIGLRIHRELGALLIGIGITLAAIGLGAALHGPALVVGWAAGAAVLAALGSRLDASPDPAGSSAERMLAAAAGFVALAIAHTLIHEAPPSAIFDGVESLGEAAVAVGACAAAALACAWSARRVLPQGARIAAFVGATALVYLGSVVIVDTVGVYGLGESRQSGQAWLSAYWTVTGLAAVVFGLLRKSADVRLAGLALLGVAIVKVWTYDLAELDQLARVLSFVGLGILLLVGAFAYARIKPEEGSPEAEPEGLRAPRS